MRSSSFARALTPLCLVATLAFSSAGARTVLADAMPTDRAGLDAYIRDYLLNNPQVLREALLKLEGEEAAANTKRILSGYKNDLYAAGSPEIGSTAAKVTIVEFYDYNCPYCRATYPQLKAFLNANPDTKLVLKDIASLGKDSEAVSRIVIAATRQGKFEVLHDALMTQKGKMTEARAIEIAGKLGVDIERLKTDARSSETGEALTRAQELANGLNVTITPLYIVGHKGIAGAPDDLVSQLGRQVDEVRKSGCDAC